MLDAPLQMYGSMPNGDAATPEPTAAPQKSPRSWMTTVGVTCCALAATAAVASVARHGSFGGSSNGGVELASADVPEQSWVAAVATKHAADASAAAAEDVNEAPQPNIVLMLIDDQGYNDIGYQSNDVTGLTPFIDQLSAGGVRLSSYYAMHLCTPARGALLTGKYPIHLGLQHDVIHIDAPWGLDLEQDLMSNHLGNAGYATHMIGKWHLGHFSETFLPQHRGFDSYFGYVSDMHDPLSHKYPHEVDGMRVSDLMMADKNQAPSYVEADGYYDAIMFTDRARDLIAHHDIGVPLFLYMAHQNTHTPFDELPDEWFTEEQLSMADGLKTTTRQQFGRSVAMLDQAVSNLTLALQAKGMWDNTLLIYSSDNGGCHTSGSSNYPLRGQKNYFFEGGMKVHAFIAGGVVPEAARNSTYNGLMHISDWLPTVLTVTGVAAPDGLDGVDQWAAMTRPGAVAPRSEMLYNIDTFVEEMSGVGPSVLVEDTHHFRAALRVGKWKLLLDEYCMGYFDPTTDEEMSLAGITETCNVTSCAAPDASSARHSYLFDLTADPNETTNLIDTYPDIASSLKDRILEFAETMTDPSWHSIDMAAYSTWSDNKFFISPWIDTSSNATTTTLNATERR